MFDADKTNRNARACFAARGVPARRGTVLIFVLGVLVMLALIGLSLIVTTTSERRRLNSMETAATHQASMDKIIGIVQETLRQDLWGNNSTLFNNDAGDEPWDAPGLDSDDLGDLWLASTVPWLDEDVTPANVKVDDDTLKWQRVSYLGTDLQDPAFRYPKGYPLMPITHIPFWVAPTMPDFETPPSSSPVEGAYIATGPSSVLTASPTMGGIDRRNRLIPPLDPGSNGPPVAAEAYIPPEYEPPAYRAPDATTARWSVAAGEAFFRQIQAKYPNKSPNGWGDVQFPYFDADFDGFLDLYDADGDGLPDSPLSFRLPAPGVGEAGKSGHINVAIRIIDNASMINVNTMYNTASYPVGSTDPNFQFRGRRVTDICFDRDGWLPLAGDNPVTFIQRRGSGNMLLYWADVVQRRLIGGLLPTTYPLFGPGDENALRHRFCLVPYSHVELLAAGGTIPEYTIDGEMPNTLRWSSYWDGTNYSPPADSDLGWHRFDFPNNRENGLTSPYGWVNMFDVEDPGTKPWFIRRALFTTVNYDQVRRPALVQADLNDPNYPNPNYPEAYHLRRATMIAPRGGLPLRMDWPVIGDPVTQPLDNAVPHPQDSSKSVLPRQRVQRIDLNMSAADRAPYQLDYLGYLAAGMHRALGPLTGGNTYQGQGLDAAVAGGTRTTVDPVWNVVGPPVTRREMLAWQFAVNMVDYRDKDDDPTVLEIGKPGSGLYVYGVERQPFLTEAYAKIAMVDNPVGSGTNWTINPAQCDYAVEIYNPWLNDPNPPNFAIVPAGMSTPVYRIKVGGGAADPVYTLGGGLANLNGAIGAPAYGYTVVANKLGLTSCPNVAIKPGLTFVQGKAILLQREIPPGSGNWVTIDEIVPVNGQTIPAAGGLEFAQQDTAGGSTNSFSLQRDKENQPGGPIPATPGPVEWQFTVAIQTPSAASGLAMHPTPWNDDDPGAEFDLGAPSLVPTPPYAATDTVPCHWFFKNDDFDTWTFDSLPELSRMLIVGHDFVKTGLSVPEFVAAVPPPAGSAPDERQAAGRIDWLSPGLIGSGPLSNMPWTHRLLEYFDYNGYNYDGIDNDGDGNVDDRTAPNGPSYLTEAYDVGYRVAGRININTAPLAVLKALPWVDPDPASLDGAELAEAIVAYRENRKPGPRGGTSTATPSGADQPFHSILELAAMRAGSAENRIDYYLDGADLANPNGPDFDDWDGDGTVGDGVIDDVWERDIILARLVNLISVRSDVFTCYIALIDDDGRYLRRTQFTIDRSNCFADHTNRPYIYNRNDTSYYDDTN